MDVVTGWWVYVLLTYGGGYTAYLILNFFLLVCLYFLESHPNFLFLNFCAKMSFICAFTLKYLEKCRYEWHLCQINV